MQMACTSVRKVERVDYESLDSESYEWVRVRMLDGTVYKVKAYSISGSTMKIYQLYEYVWNGPRAAAPWVIEFTDIESIETGAVTASATLGIALGVIAVFGLVMLMISFVELDFHSN